MLGVQVHPLGKATLLKLIVNWAAASERRRVYHVNVHAMNIARDSCRFHASLNDADLVYCDGEGVRLAARLLGFNIPERLTVMSWLDDLLGQLAENELSVFFVGDELDVLDSMVERAERSHPNLRIAGVHHGFFDLEGETSEYAVKMILESKPSVIFVAMGMPRQEFWIDDNLGDLPNAVYIPVGAALRWYTGHGNRPPLWMTERGMEWLGRLIMEPRRLARRYIIGNPRFLLRVALSRLKPHQ